jgi:hypothetical protein
LMLMEWKQTPPALLLLLVIPVAKYGSQTWILGGRDRRMKLYWFYLCKCMWYWNWYGAVMSIVRSIYMQANSLESIYFSWCDWLSVKNCFFFSTQRPGSKTWPSKYWSAHPDDLSLWWPGYYSNMVLIIEKKFNSLLLKAQHKLNYPQNIN